MLWLDAVNNAVNNHDSQVIFMLFIFYVTDPDLSRSMNYSMIVGRESFRYPSRLPKIFWYYRKLSSPLRLCGSSSKAVAGIIQKLQIVLPRCYLQQVMILVPIFYWINLARNTLKHNVKLPKVPWCIRP